MQQHHFYDKSIANVEAEITDGYTSLQNLEEIEITTDFDGCFQLQEIRLADENLPGCDAELADLHLRKMDLLRRPAVLPIQKPSYDAVQNTLFHFFPP